MNSEAKLKAASRGASVVIGGERDYQTIVTELAPLLGVMKRVLFVLVLLTITLILTSQKQWFLQLVDHEIKQISVKGDLYNLTPKQVEKALPALIGSSFLTADLDSIKAQVEELPWVNHVTVTRVWPSDIVLTIKEQVAASYWNSNAFLSKEGEIFQPENVDVNLGLPVLLGANDDKPSVRIGMLSVLAHLKTLLAEYKLGVVELELKPRGVWDVLLNNGISVSLGAQPLDEKIHRLGTVFTKGAGIDFANIKRIDARYPNGVAVEWKEPIMLAGSGRNR